MNYSLSNIEIKKALHIPVISYRRLASSILKPGKGVVILFETRPNVGHWTLLFDRGNSIEFFDSYGLKPDQELRKIDKSYRIESNQLYPKLLTLLSESGRKIEYSPYKLQRIGASVNTCGRWVVIRYLNKNLTIDEFHKSIMNLARKEGLTPDKLVLKMTS